ncbi:hypothetical protein Pcinc_024908 [Petrolisthes cinctipes]|uniref:Uncharacterized protein n=1 Tax=Petrolisthes cinctipes TaxID=88211 RepID=A0AAE1KA62_PETCI|nr:hypothetical protein Pcinc_024908 [Petrolisthes cinctipes]
MRHSGQDSSSSSRQTKQESRRTRPAWELMNRRNGAADRRADALQYTNREVNEQETNSRQNRRQTIGTPKTEIFPTGGTEQTALTYNNDDNNIRAIATGRP